MKSASTSPWEALQLPPPCLFGGRAAPEELATAHMLRARAVCAMEEAWPPLAADHASYPSCAYWLYSDYYSNYIVSI